MESMEAPDLRAFGRPLAVTTLPLCPELRLWLLSDEVDLEHECAQLSDCDPPPYWAFCWGSGQALARFLLDHPEEVRGRRVVDFGTGGGVAAIAAAKAGASEVIAVDTDPDAHGAALANAALNGVELQPSQRMPEGWDVLLASDVLYERSNADWLLALGTSPGRQVLLSDPERACTPPLPSAPLYRYAVTTLPDVDSPSRSAAVFALGGDG